MYRSRTSQLRFVARLRRAIAVVLVGLLVGTLISPSASLADSWFVPDDGIADSPLVP
jgi:hypothetical protein